eukprot:1835093-Amphidinium_carterae.1
MAEHEHNVAREVVREGRQFFAFIEDRARGFSQEEAVTAREKCDYGLSLYRKSDARRQQEHFSQLQQTLRTSNEEEMARSRLNLRSQYQLEFRSELDSVKKGVEHRSSLSEQRLLSKIGEIRDVAQTHQNVNHQLELRMEQ